MQTENKQEEMKNQLVGLAKRGHFHAKSANATKNKTQFSKAPEGVNASVARFLVATSPTTTEKTIINWSEKSNGLTVGQASALCKSAHAYALSITDSTILNSATLSAFTDALDSELSAYLATLDDTVQDDLSEEDDLIGEIADDDLSDDDEPTPTATVEGDFISYEAIKKCLATVESRNAVLQGAMAVFFSDDNTDDAGHFQYRIDGKARTKSISDMEPSAKSKKTQSQLFMDKVASMGGMNLAGVATKRGGKWASDHVFKAGSETATPNRDTNRLIRNRLGIAWCAVVVGSGSTDCTLDMRKFVSDETIDRLRSALVCPQADLSDATYTKNNQQVQYANGWLHNYSRGNGNGSTSFNDLMEDNTTFL